MVGTAIPDRVQWAVDRLDVRPDQRILDVGCGPGVAAGLIADRLGTGIVIGIDRSATAIARAVKRNTMHIAAGRAQFTRADLARYEQAGPPFDSVVAMNVNVFWTGPAVDEWRRIGELLAPTGRLFLFYGYGPGDPTRNRDLAGPLTVALNDRGYTADVDHSPDGSSICVTGVLTGGLRRHRETEA
jgi:SAM-dependent methyltransferase